jgi:hypothetical protein
MFRKGLSKSDFFKKGEMDREHSVLGRVHEFKTIPFSHLLGRGAAAEEPKEKQNPLLKRVR